MFTAQDPGALMWVILMIVAAAVAFWRTMIKLVIICITVLVVWGFIDVVHSLH
jgi:hypothetical protein